MATRTKAQLRDAGLKSWAARRRRYGKTGISPAARRRRSRPAAKRK